MKIVKILAFAACAAVAAAMGTACSDVTDPVLQKPDAAKFKMLTPPLQDQFFKLSENGAFELVLSGQPDYGFSTVVQYRAEVSLTQDFAKYETLTPTGTGTLSRMTLRESDLALALCTLRGVTEEEDFVYNTPEPVYFRGVAFITGIEDSYVTTSNVVSLNKVQGYYAVRKPQSIYCIGNYLGDWIGPDVANAEALVPYMVSEDENDIGSNVFHATIDFQTNAPIFRFYTGLNGWDKPADFSADGKTGPAAFFSLGATGGNDDDNPVQFPDFVAGSTLTHQLMETKDSFSFPNYTGVINITVDLKDVAAPMATFTTPE